MKKNLQLNLNKLENKIINISKNKTYNYYIMESTEFIEKYKQILQKPVIFFFLSEKEIINKMKKKK